MKIALILLTLGLMPAAAAQVPSTAEQSHIRELLAPAGARWAVTRRMNPAMTTALACPDFKTVDMVVELITQARTDRMVSIATGGKSELMQRALPEVDPAKFGCAPIALGTRVLVETADPVPVISTAAVRGVTHPAMIEYETPRR